MASLPATAAAASQESQVAVIEEDDRKVQAIEKDAPDTAIASDSKPASAPTVASGTGKAAAEHNDARQAARLKEKVASSRKKEKVAPAELKQEPRNEESDSMQDTNDKPASSRGLSELSKQLRMLQAKNQSQCSEIDRLERQLKIMSDLKGISVSDLRSALQTACRGEAHADLLSQISSLQAQLEAKTLATSKADDFEKQASSRAIATLQLRVGELEEVEQALRKEIATLYTSLNEQTTRGTRLESNCASLEQRLQERLVEDTAIVVHEQQPDNQWQERAGVAEMELQVYKDRGANLEQQLEAREKEWTLRQEQFKSRFQVQDERIADLEQQLSSLYVAFEMMRQEQSEEHVERNTLKSNLYESDRQVARNLQEEAGTVVATPLDHDSKEAAAIPVVDPIAQASLHETSPPASPPQFAASQPATVSPYLQQQQQQNTYNNSVAAAEPIAAGYLWKWDKKILKGWKKRYFVLTGGDGNGVYELSYSDGPQQTIKGTFFITAGLSTVTKTSQFANKPHAFTVLTDPYDGQAPMLHAAVPSDKVLQQWLTILHKVTTGQEGAAVGEESDLELAMRLQMEMM